MGADYVNILCVLFFPLPKQSKPLTFSLWPQAFEFTKRPWVVGLEEQRGRLGLEK